ncbi:zinc transport system permease protein [Ruminiclostridium sufflavum DSM 19573]|uniref:Zinc transport system permease protein n=1 Tax=Ruminiclostridium sufflavum DSM 19573 TaxID=1121337 RepID=A0A318XNI3_9FIRM|nr:metal ABC transporter permease [Ruminiclostridium sufflavum]PYG87139.1 zinc transport system permease protein [Ruminiclostridium sufflavum DSM 19573]
MSQIYNILDIILPFDWLSYDFMKNAFLAVLLITPVFAILGTIIVNNRMAFFSDALGHGAFTGIAIGTAIGIIQPMWSAILFSIAFSVLITIAKNKTKTSTDTVIGVFSSAAIALGLVIINASKYSSLFVGDLLSISSQEIGVLLVLALAVIVLWILFYNRVLMVSLNQSLARSRGVNTLAVELILTSLIAVVVTVCIQWVGLLIINSLLVLPAAAARNVSTNARQYNGIALIVSVVSGISGLILSYYFDMATGATIVIVSAVIYFITLALRKRFV